MPKFKTKYGIIKLYIAENIGIVLASKENMTLEQYAEKYNLPPSKKEMMVELLKRKEIEFII